MASWVASGQGQRATSECLLGARWRRPVFAVASREYDWLDVFLAAMARGDWDDFERSLIAGLACLAEADAAGSWPHEAQIAAVATSFRYERGLLAGAEAVSWLAGHGVTLEAWNESLVRRILVKDWHDHLETLIGRHGPSLRLTSDAFVAEGICGGWFDRFAANLAGRVAVSATARDDGPDAGLPPSQRVAAAQHPRLSALDTADVGSRFDHLRTIDGRFAAAARRALDGGVLGAEIARHPIDWTRVDLEVLSFASPDAAREAVALIRDDGQTITDVAIEAGQAVADRRVLLEDLPAAWHHAVFAARAEVCLGPFLVDDRYDVAWLVAKTPPDPGDVVVRRRAEAAVLGRLMSAAALAEVTWIAPRPAVAGVP